MFSSVHRKYYRSEIPPQYKTTGDRKEAPSIYHHPKQYCRHRDIPSRIEILPVIIKTAVNNYERREMQRKIIMLENSAMRATTLSYVFLIGLGFNENRPEALNTEMGQYDDIILADFDDSYKNLTLKTTVALGLVHSHEFIRSCQKFSWILIQDDDVYVNYKTVIPSYILVSFQ